MPARQEWGDVFGEFREFLPSEVQFSRRPLPQAKRKRQQISGRSGAPVTEALGESVRSSRAMTAINSCSSGAMPVARAASRRAGSVSMRLRTRRRSGAAGVFAMASRQALIRTRLRRRLVRAFHEWTRSLLEAKLTSRLRLGCAQQRDRPTAEESGPSSSGRLRSS
jgi:hypothetical protein